MSNTLNVVKDFRKLLSSVVILLFTISVFWNMYEGQLDKSLIFALLLIAVEIENIGDRLEKNGNV